MTGFKQFVRKNWFGLVSVVISAAVILAFMAGIGDWKGTLKSITGINPFWMTAAVICTANQQG